MAKRQREESRDHRKAVTIKTSALSVAELLQALPFPCLVTDEAGRILYGNTAYAGLMNVLSINAVMGRLRFDSPKLQSAWRTALAQAMVESTGAALTTSAAGRQWHFKLTAVRNALEVAPLARLIVVVCEEKAATADVYPDTMSKTGMLTKAEERVLAGLLQGLTARTIARSRGASVNTVRSQISAILQKTGRNTQKKLIASFGASAFGASSFSSGFGLSDVDNQSLEFSEAHLSGCKQLV